jgi:hypothetical protein
MKEGPKLRRDGNHLREAVADYRWCANWHRAAA